MNESLDAQALRELGGMVCACGAKKERNHSFCRECYFALPPEVRKTLFKRLNDGYANAWDDAKEWLKGNTERLDRKA